MNDCSFFCVCLKFLDLGLNKNNNKKKVNITNYIDILYVVGILIGGFQNCKFLQGKNQEKQRAALENAAA